MKEDNRNETPSESGLGKFKSVDALLRAYGELEAEFTRKCQRLKTLEEREKSEPVQSAEPSPKEEPEEGAAKEPETAQSADPETLYRAVMGNAGVRARVLSDYLESLRGVPLLSKTGVGVTAPVSRPKSFAEAGSLALGYFKSEK